MSKINNNNNKLFNLKYIVNLGLHLGNREQNRKVWLDNFVLGSRRIVDVLNLNELLKRLEILGPIITLIVKNGGSILVVNKRMTIESSFLGKLFSTKPYSGIVYLYVNRWLEGAFTNFFNFKLLNLRQLPTILFLLDFYESKNMLEEAYFLRIPVVGLVSTTEHSDVIFKRIALPIPSGNSIKAIFFFFNFLKYYILKGVYFSEFNLKKDTFFDSFLKNISTFKQSFKNKLFFSDFLMSNLSRSTYLFYLKNFYRNTALISPNDSYSDTLMKGSRKLKYDHMKLVASTFFWRGFLQRFKGVIKNDVERLAEKNDVYLKFGPKPKKIRYENYVFLETETNLKQSGKRMFYMPYFDMKFIKRDSDYNVITNVTPYFDYLQENWSKRSKFRHFKYLQNIFRNSVKPIHSPRLLRKRIVDTFIPDPKDNVKDPAKNLYARMFSQLLHFLRHAPQDPEGDLIGYLKELPKYHSEADRQRAQYYIKKYKIVQRGRYLDGSEEEDDLTKLETTEEFLARNSKHLKFFTKDDDDDDAFDFEDDGVEYDDKKTIDLFGEDDDEPDFYIDTSYKNIRLVDNPKAARFLKSNNLQKNKNNNKNFQKQNNYDKNKNYKKEDNLNKNNFISQKNNKFNNNTNLNNNKNNLNNSNYNNNNHNNKNTFNNKNLNHSNYNKNDLNNKKFNSNNKPFKKDNLNSLNNKNIFSKEEKKNPFNKNV